MAKAAKSSDAFVQAVERALEHLTQVDWLGSQSPLAAPYFLGSLLDSATAGQSPVTRGQALQNALHSAAQAVSDEQQGMLNATFFQRNPNLNNTGVSLELGLSESTYYRRRIEAIEALAHALNQSVQPPLRNELPRAPQLALVGRSGPFASGMAALRAGHSVAITGRSGIGKTTLGAALAHDWPAERAFWFTVRPGLNDNLSSFAFALGHFLRQRGGPVASNTWRQLVADRGAPNATRILGLLRHDLAAFQATPILLCLDESDQLRPEAHAHAEVIHAIEALSMVTPVLLISQQALIEAQQHVVLTGLSLGESLALLAQEGGDLIEPSHPHAQQLHRIARGNPALLKLCAMLQKSGEPIETIMQQLESGRSIEALFNRIWKRLSDAERGLLMALAVYRAAAPPTAWQDQASIIDTLIQRDLLNLDTHDGLAVMPQLREFVLQRVPADAQPALQHLAADTRALHGEYTEAAYHYVQAGQPALAVWLWFNHREEEQERGHAQAALALFSHIRRTDLPDEEDQRLLALLRAEHAVLQGDGNAAEQTLADVHWPINHPALAFVRQLQGDALEMQGRVEQALERYREGIRHLTGHGLDQRVRLQVKTGYIYAARLRDLPQAQQEAALALWRAEQFQGYVEEESGHFASASRHYENALNIAQRLTDQIANTAAVAEVHHHLGHLHMRTGQAEAAIRHLTIAVTHAEKTGQPVNALFDQLNLASAYIVAGDYETASSRAQAALILAQQIQHTFLLAGLSACAAEAELNLGHPDTAEQLATQSLLQEEEIHRPYALTVLGQVQLQRGQLDQAQRTLHMAVDSAQQSQDKFAEAPAWRALGLVLRAQQDAPAAQAAFTHAQQLLEELGLPHEVTKTH